MASPRRAWKARLTSVGRAALPYEAWRISHYAQRFRRFGYPARWSLARQRRAALDVSLIELLPKRIRESGGVVIDVGANDGSWSLAILQLLSPQHLLAFEPQNQVFTILQKRLRGYPVAQCFPVALGANSAEMPMRIHPIHQLSSFLPLTAEMRTLHGSLPDSQHVPVPLRRLDEYTAPYQVVSLLKLDVQGFEVQVLRGACRTLERTESILTEILYKKYYAGGNTFADLNTVLCDAGFRVFGISAPSCGPDGQPLYADAVYVRNSVD